MLNNRIRTTALLTALLVFSLTAAACSLSAAPTPISQPEQKVITVVGKGEAKGTSDQARVNVGVDVFDTDVTLAVQKNEATIQAIMEALKSMGIAPEDTQTSNFSLFTEQRFDDQLGTNTTGYRVTNQYSVTIRDIGRVNQVLEAVIKAGANNIYGVEFTLSDTSTLESQARASALQDAQQRAAELAKMSGVSLGSILAISEVINPISPIPAYGIGGGDASQAAAPRINPGIAPGQFNLISQVQVTFELK